MMKKIIFTFMVVMLFISITPLNSFAVEVTKSLEDAFKSGKLVVKGDGVAPEKMRRGKARLMALRAAKVDALRNLLETVKGVSLSGEKTLSDDLEISTKLEGFVRGAVEVDSQYDDGVATVYLELAVTGNDSLLSELQPQALASFESADRFSTEVDMEVEKPFDGLIVDATGHDFKPALINRILTGDDEKGNNEKIIYDPSVVSPSVLALRGSAEYTTEVGKAKASLEERNSSNPLVVKVVSLLNPTDVILSKDDRDKIVSSNKSENFLEGAKVVFVLD